MYLSPRTSRLVFSLTGIGLVSLLSGCSLLNQITSTPEAPVRNPEGNITEGSQNADVFLIRVGDCLNDAELSGEVDSVPTAPCDQPHDSEVYAETRLSFSSFDDDANTEAADEYCYTAFPDFVGIAYEESSLDYSYYLPTAESWADGDKTVSCIIYDPGARVTGTLGGTAR